MERHQPENLIVIDDEVGNVDREDRSCGSESDYGRGYGGSGGWDAGKGGGIGVSGGWSGGGKVVVTREEVISNLVELFKEVCR